MPGGMNGSQLAVEAQRLRPGIKVLLTSGYVANLDEGQVIGRGELPVLSKPYRRDDSPLAPAGAWRRKTLKVSPMTIRCQPSEVPHVVIQLFSDVLFYFYVKIVK